MISLFVGWMIRIYDTSKFITVKINFMNLIANHVVLSVQILLIFLFNGPVLMVLQAVCLVILLVVNLEIVKGLFETIKKFMYSKKKKINS